MQCYGTIIVIFVQSNDMSSKSQRRRKLKENLFNKRRLIILNEDTFEETFSLKLTLMNVFWLQV
jgi:hypothetical protein